jgi:hypothetical protein
MTRVFYKSITLALFILFSSVFTISSVFAQSARIESVTGKVLLKRRTWSDFVPVAILTTLEEQDQIRVAKGSRVRVMCPNRNHPFWTSDEPIGVKRLCGGWELTRNRGSQAAATLGGVDASIPYLISPRHTLLLSHKPTFRWNRVIGATQYIVQVKNSRGTVWEATTQNSQIIYPGNPVLEPGVAYSVIVKASTGKSSEQDGVKQRPTAIDFRILRAAAAEEVKKKVTAITQNSLSPDVTALMLASFYGDYVLPASVAQTYELSDRTVDTYSLTTDAIDVLESQIKQGKKSPALYRTLGNLYWQIGLVRPAIECYSQALDLIQSPEDLEEWTLAQYSLGLIYAAIDDTANAHNHYRQARAGFLFLSDAQRANAIQRRIEKKK